MTKRKAKKVEQLQVECVACGTINAVDRRTGEVIAYAAHRADDPPPDPSSNAAPNDPPNDPPQQTPDPPASEDTDDDTGSFLEDW